MQRAGAGGHGIASRSGPRAEFANRPPQMRGTPSIIPRGAHHASRGMRRAARRASCSEPPRTDNASRASQPIAVTISSHHDVYLYLFAFIFGFVYLVFAQGALGAFSPDLPGIICTF